jgi:parallel beta-helix repeat protein
MSQRTRVEGNTISDNNQGVRADNSFNIIVRNTLTNNADNLGQVTGGNRVGTLSSDPNTAGPWANLQ